MKRITFLLITVFAMAVTNAQDISDGLRYSLENNSGTARFNALSGSFGALGGDVSAIAINPAGSAVFLTNSITVSLGVNDIDNSATYFNTSVKSNQSDFNLNQAGAVFVFNSRNEDSSWKKFSIGVNYLNNKNYNDDLFIAGTGNTSIGEFFLANAQGVPLDLLQLQSGETISDLYAYLGETQGAAAQNAFLGYQGYIIDPVDPNDPQNSHYILNIAPGSFNHEFVALERGYRGKYTANFATQYTDNFYFGINLNSHIIDYDQSTYLYEGNSNVGSLVSEVGFENNLSVLGSGFSAQIGGIMKIGQNSRIGLTFDTPTWYVVSEETTQYLETNRIEDEMSINEIINPRVLNIYEDYDLRTPGKISVSAAHIFGKSGLLSFDYSYSDFSNIQFGPTSDPVFASENTTINDLLQGAGSYRLGGEYRFEQLSLRAGLRYNESPYKDGNTIGDTKGFSLGLGYNFGNYSFDLSYARAEQERNQQLYNIGLTDSAAINTVYSNFVFTLGFNL
ncbi:MAG: transporter [Altibacter sp.]|uniref:OmpP1/FadL family transporter n=1 Tax=Altibacter sp. TaxID=2024823 RepID=UPI001DBDB80E|nr:outer membrane protein transport protein [Altibacter sp.]MBZ0328539.1 transporter [Altibacter sp.]